MARGSARQQSMIAALAGLLCAAILQPEMWAQSGDVRSLTTHPQAVNSSGAGTISTEPEEVTTLRRMIATGHADEALKGSAALRAQRGTQAGLSRMEGLAYYALGQLQPADEAFAKALKENPSDVEAAEMRGLTLVRLGRPAEAIPLLESVKGQAVPGESKADPNYVLARCYVDVHRYDDARHAFAAQFAVAPDSAPAYLLAARMLLRREHVPVAQSFAEKALQLDPKLPLAHALLGEILLADSRLEPAIAEFEQERKTNPLEPSVYDRLGDAYGRAGQNEKARQVLQEAVLLEPNTTGPYILLGRTLLRQGDAVGASEYLAHAEKMDPENPVTHSLLGQAYRTMGRKEDAGRETAAAAQLQTASGPKLENVH